jgi:hypothetical protein
VLAGGFSGGKLASAPLTLPLTLGKFDHLGSLMFLLMLSSTAPFMCKTLLLFLGIVGLAATLLEIEEGKTANSVVKL